MTFNIDISEVMGEVGTEGSRARFKAMCRETGDAVVAKNPEVAICRKMVELGREDGPVQTWRGTTPSLHHPSLHRWGAKK